MVTHHGLPCPKAPTQACIKTSHPGTIVPFLTLRAQGMLLWCGLIIAFMEGPGKVETAHLKVLNLARV